ncbi:MAG: hypothetical protein ABW139_10580 [Candidatus Thiodiazotropha sp. DIVDIV]
MKHYTSVVRMFIVVVFGLLQVSVLSADDRISSAADTRSTHGPDTLVVVEKVIGIDVQGKKHTLYQEQDGKVYRLEDINQVVHDLNARGIKSKGSFRALQAVLGDRVYVMGKNNQPYPALRHETGIPESLGLAVDTVRVTKDLVTAIYSTNCQDFSI